MGSTRRDLTRHRTRSYNTSLRGKIKQTRWQTKQHPVVNGSMGCVTASILWMLTAATPCTATHVICTTSLSTWSQAQDCSVSSVGSCVPSFLWLWTGARSARGMASRVMDVVTVAQFAAVPHVLLYSSVSRWLHLGVSSRICSRNKQQPIPSAGLTGNVQCITNCTMSL